jgi:hypothetical protein
MNNKITWKPVIGFLGWYEVSDRGDVRSLDRKDHRGRFWAGKTLKARSHSKGYLKFLLSKNGKNCQIFAHRMVIESFIGPSSMQVDHLNGRKTDNRLENLEYVTCLENIKRRYSIKYHKPVRKVGSR